MKNSKFDVFKRVLILLLFLIIFYSCSNSYTGKTYESEYSEYIKFISSSKIEWKWDDKFRPEESEYTIEDNKIRVVRKVLGIEQIKYIDILENDELKDENGVVYKLKQ